MKKHLFYIAVSAFVAASLVSCGDDDPTIPLFPPHNTEGEIDPNPNPNPNPKPDPEEKPDPAEMPVVKVVFGGSEALVSGEGMISSVSGNHVMLTNPNTDKEYKVVLSGSVQNGSLTYIGEYKATIELDNLSLKSAKGAAIDIQCGKRIVLRMTENSVNSLEDSNTGNQKAALYCKGHLEIDGAGILNVKSNAAHGIATKEYLQIKRSVVAVNVTGSEKDGIHVGQYYEQRGGKVTITANKGDALQVEYVLDDNDALDAEKENNGQLLMRGGSLTASATFDATEVLKVDDNVVVSGGTLVLDATGAGSRCIKTNGSLFVNQTDDTVSMTLNASGKKWKNPSDLEDTTSSRQIKADGNITINGGVVTGTVSGKAKPESKCDGKYYRGDVSGVSITIEAAGGATNL